MKIRPRSIEKEAMRFTGTNQDDVSRWVGRSDLNHDVVMGLARLYIPTLEGVMMAIPGDWIVKGVSGEIYPVKPEIFEKSYEVLE